VSADKGRHDSGQTSQSQRSGEGGRHTRVEDRPAGWHVGTRLDRPHHPDGWDGHR
jgi:hypothetical protein